MAVQDSTDAALVARVAQRDDQAFAELFDRHASKVLGVLVPLLRRRELAEEILQEAFLQAWSQAERYRPERATVAGWLLMLARYRALDHLRASRARGQREERVAAEPTAPAVSPPVGTGNLERSERRRLVLHALTQLGEDQRRCVELAFFEGLSHSQIAERLGQPLGTVKSRLLAGMKKLRRSLSPVYQP
jgi:RNA polymerase sigma-70 factor (ECF subfamily)